MKPARAVAYRQATPGRMIAGTWETLSNEAPAPLPSILAPLDYLSRVRLRREVIVDLAGLRTDCGLSKGVPLTLAASWSSTGTTLKRSLTRVDLVSADDACLVELAGEIPGAGIAGTLHIDTNILMGGPQDNPLPLIAGYVGSILLSERCTVALDESASFFPVEIVDFRAGVWANPDAGWRLSWNSLALDQPFLGTVRLFINSAHQRIAQAVTNEPPSAEADAIRSAIYFDVARTLVSGALASEEFVERDGDYADGSCGRVLYVLIQMLFPGDALPGLRNAATERTDHFNTDLQGRLRVFWGAK